MSEGGGADERLIVMLEARISEFEKRMAKAERSVFQLPLRVRGTHVSSVPARVDVSPLPRRTRGRRQLFGAFD